MLHAVYAGDAPSPERVLDAVQQAKRTLAAGGDFLEYVLPDRDLADGLLDVVGVVSLALGFWQATRRVLPMASKVRSGRRSKAMKPVG